MFFLCLDFWASQFIIQFESLSVSLDNSFKWLSSVNVSRSSPSFQLHLVGYFITTYKGSPIAGLPYLLEQHMFVLFESTQYFINQLELDNIIGLSV